MYCIIIELELNSGDVALEPIQQQDLKSLILRSLKLYAPEASISFVGDGRAGQEYKWIVMAHMLASDWRSKTVNALNKSFETYGKIYGNPRITASVMVEQ